MNRGSGCIGSKGMEYSQTFFFFLISATKCRTVVATHFRVLEEHLSIKYWFFAAIFEVFNCLTISFSFVDRGFQWYWQMVLLHMAFSCRFFSFLFLFFFGNDWNDGSYSNRFPVFRPWIMECISSGSATMLGYYKLLFCFVF